MSSINPLYISKLALGTVQFGMDYGISNIFGKTRHDEVKKIVNKAHNSGINTIDTANAYGESEKVIGSINCKDFNIITKFPGSVQSKDQLKTSITSSLKNLNVSHLYGYLAHDADTLLDHPELWNTLQDLKKDKVVEKIGYSLYVPEQLEKLISKNIVPDLIQVPYNFIDNRFETYFKQLKSIGCEIHVRSVFLQGLFFLQPENLNPFFEPIKPLLIELRKHFNHNHEIAGFLMNFVLNNSYVDKLVFGVNTETQLIENIMNLHLNTNTKTLTWNSKVPLNILMPNKWPINQ